MSSRDFVRLFQTSMLQCIIRHESAEFSTAKVAGQDSPLFLTQFPLVTRQVFQYGCYSHILNTKVCVLRTFSPGVSSVCLPRQSRKTGTALARACEVCVLPHPGPAESGTVTATATATARKTHTLSLECVRTKGHSH